MSVILGGAVDVAQARVPDGRPASRAMRAAWSASQARRIDVAATGEGIAGFITHGQRAM
ncbi:MAG TPA: hypothetical protein VGB85_31700 [Nannocystis sp.]